MVQYLRTRKKNIKLYTKVIQGLRGQFGDLLQKLTKAVQTEVADPEARQVLFESQTFKMIIKHTK